MKTKGYFLFFFFYSTLLSAQSVTNLSFDVRHDQTGAGISVIENSFIRYSLSQIWYEASTFHRYSIDWGNDERLDTTIWTEFHLDYQYAEAGTYDLCITGMFSVDGVIFELEDTHCHTVYINDDANCIAYFTHEQTEDLFLQVQDSSITTNVVDNRLWIFDGDTVPDLAQVDYTYTESGHSLVCLMIETEAACQHQYCKQILIEDLVSAIETTISSPRSFQVFNSPHQAFISIQMLDNQSTIPTNQQIIITNILGEQIQLIQPMHQKETFLISTQNWGKGIYWIQLIENGQRKQVEKIAVF